MYLINVKYKKKRKYRTGPSIPNFPFWVGRGADDFRLIHALQIRIYVTL